MIKFDASMCARVDSQCCWDFSFVPSQKTIGFKRLLFSLTLPNSLNVFKSVNVPIHLGPEV